MKRLNRKYFHKKIGSGEMKNWILNSILNRERKLQDRMLRLLLVLGMIICMISLVETTLTSVGKQSIGQILILFVFTLIAFFSILRQKKVSAFVSVIVYTTVYLVFPALFLTGGGIRSGTPIWLLLGFVFLAFINTGKRFLISVIASVLECVGLYSYAMCNPDRIPVAYTEEMAYFDSCFSLLMVAVSILVLIRFQMFVLQQEKEVVVQQKNDLEELSDTKEKFFSNMSHELRSPINTIIGINEMILRQSTDQEILEYAGNVQIASKMLLSLVNDILDFSQMEMNQMQIVEGAYYLQDLVQEMVDMIAIRMREKKLNFQVCVDENLPNHLLGDSRRIQQIILNLLTNAQKYTEQGSVTMTVYGEYIDDENLIIKCSVSDTGMGIRKEDLDLLFENYSRVNEEKTKRIEGTGLGLPITKELAKMMGGDIRVDSIYKKGSTFTVSIPQKVLSETAIGNIDFLENKRDVAKGYVPLFIAPTARLLVVDDNAMNTMVVTKLLNQTKLQIDVAHSGEECLKLTKEKHYHLIMLDHRMPGLSGIETLHQIRKQENGLCKHTICFFFTAETEQKARQICEEYDFADFILKPIVGEKLEKVLARYLPSEYVESMQETALAEGKKKNTTVLYKKKVGICTDCVSDLSEDIIEQLGISVMYLYIRTPKGRFADTREITIDSMTRLHRPEATVEADSASVEEYEEFFASNLMKAEQVIYISMAKGAGRTYGNALKAAESFGNVHVVDSGLISGGQGLLTIRAARMVQSGMRCEEILQTLKDEKQRISSRFLLPNVSHIYKRGYVDRFHYNVFSRLGLHPTFGIINGNARIAGFYVGHRERIWRSFVRSQFFGRKKWIDRRSIIVSYTGCNPEEMEWLKEEILKQVKFENYIEVEASFSTACSAGIGSIGISFAMLPKDS